MSQQFHQYQQNKQLPYHLKKLDTIYANGNQGPRLGQAQQCGRVEPVIEMTAQQCGRVEPVIEMTAVPF